MVANANFGASIDISTLTGVNGFSKTAIIGSPGQGVAYVFDFNDQKNEWEQVGARLAPGVNNEADCGVSVAVYKSYYFVGCPEDDEKGKNNSIWIDASFVSRLIQTKPFSFAIQLQTLAQCTCTYVKAIVLHSRTRCTLMQSTTFLPTLGGHLQQMQM